jgi:hypothetical protein
MGFFPGRFGGGGVSGTLSGDGGLGAGKVVPGFLSSGFIVEVLLAWRGSIGLVERAGSLSELLERAGVDRLEAAGLGGSEVVGETERREVCEHFLESAELRLDVIGARRECLPRLGVGAEATKWVL